MQQKQPRLSCTFEEEKGGIYLENIKNVIEINDNHFHNIKENMALRIIHPEGSTKDEISNDF